MGRKAKYTIKWEYNINCWDDMYSVRDENGKEVYRSTNNLFLQETFIPQLLKERYYKDLKKNNPKQYLKELQEKTYEDAI